MTILRTALLFALALLPLYAAVDGVVTNKTTGKVQTGAEVALLRMAEDGTVSVVNRTTTNAEGRFAFSDTLSGIHALETTYRGAAYFQVIPPMLPPNNLQVAVYDVSGDAASISVDQHIFFLEPGQQQVVVSESYILKNSANYTYRDLSKGSLRFFLPPEAKGIVQVSFIGPDQRPRNSTTKPTATKNVLQVDEPLLPGENRVDLNYVLPYTGGEGTFRTRIVEGGGRVRVVAPPGVTLEGEGLASLGIEPRTQAQIFGFSGEEMRISMRGSGAISDAGAAPASESQGPRIRSIRPAVYDNINIILGAGGLALFFALVLLYRRSSSSSHPQTGDSK